MIAADLDERAHALAIKALVDASIAPWSTFDYDDVPGTNRNQGIAAAAAAAPDMFVELALERRANAQLRAVGVASATGWRVLIRSVARSVDECRWLMWHCATALNEQRLTVGASVSTHVHLESETAPAYDDGRYSAESVWTYAL